MKNRILLIIFGLFLLTTGCQELEIENPNNPNQEDVLKNAGSLKNLAGSVFQNWYLYNVGLDQTPAFMLGTAADATSSSWGNFAMRDMSYEPRKAWNNNPSYVDAAMTESYYDNMYSLLSMCNDVLNAINTNPDLEFESEQEKNMVKAVAKLGQGISLGYIGLVFDKGFIVKEDDDPTEEFELESYQEIIDAAIISINEAIDLASTNYFEIPEPWINGVTMDNTRFYRLANFMAAKILLSEPRTQTENEEVERWEKIRDYLKDGKGLTQDYTITADKNAGSWASLYHFYATWTGWSRVDMRVVAMLDTADLPPVWPEEYQGDYTNFPNNGEAVSPDYRLQTDFQFMVSHYFNPERGYYYFSTYRYSRFDNIRYTGFPGQGPIPLYRKAESDYMLAEAYVRAENNLTQAINILNNSARVLRGGPGMEISTSASRQEVLDAIFYERTIELFSNNMGIQYFDMRRFDKLQKGTPLHMPLPGGELETLEMSNYTFGGADNAGEEGTADSGWKEQYELTLKNTQ
jgi:hypothetical protein